MRDIDKTIILMASKVISSANIFVLSIFFARMLLKADYGTYIQVNMIINMMVLFLALGLPPSMFFFLPKNNNQKYLIKRTFAVLISIGIVNAFVMFFFKDYVAKFLNNDGLSQFVVLACICITCRIGYNIVQPILLVIKESVVLSIINVFKGVLLFSTMISCLFAGTDISTLIYVLTGNYLVELVITLWVILKYSSHFSDNYNDIIVSLRTQFKFALPLSMSGVLWILGRELDKYVVSHYLNPELLAVYARGAVEIPLVQILAATIAQVYLPNWVSLFDKKDFKTLLSTWHLTITKTALIMFPVFVLFLIIGYDFIVLMYSKEYAGSVPIFLIYLFLVPLQLTEYTAIVESSGKTILISFGYVFQILLNLIFSILLIKQFGAMGPAIVTILTMYLWVTYILFIISKICNVGMKDVFPWIKLIRLMIICLLSGSLPYVLTKTINNFGVFELLVIPEVIYLSRIIFVSLIFGITYLFMLFITKTLDADDKATLSRWLLINKFKKIIR